jgi:CRP-like cAMP-binding protein
LLGQGEVSKSVFFNLKGSIYQYVSHPEIDYTIIDLHIENEWIVNHRSFVAQLPAESFISAYTEGSVLEISIESIHYLISRSLAFLQLNKILEQSMSRVYFFDNALTPLQKWQFILMNKPQLIERFPLKIIASYLKIAPETLSRAREKLARSKVIS